MELTPIELADYHLFCQYMKLDHSEEAMDSWVKARKENLPYAYLYTTEHVNHSAGRYLAALIYGIIALTFLYFLTQIGK